MSITFESLGLGEAMVSSLEKRGYITPTDIQGLLIPEFLNESMDMIAQAATGTGKTGAFGIPLIDQMDVNRKGVHALVLAPTRELASQVAKELVKFAGKRQINVIELCGGQGMREQIQQLKKVNKATIAVGTPGRVLDHLDKKRLNTKNLTHFIIDEVDEMLNFGFKEDMDRIVEYLPTDRRTIILSATLPSFVMKVAKAYIHNPKVINAMANAPKPDISEQFYRVKRVSKFQLLCRVMDSMVGFYGFIFCNTKREVDELAEKLIKSGYPVESLHGDLSQAQRNRAFEKFKTKQCKILVVTDVAARGIDVKNISHVINTAVPQNLEVYTHRIGRTGRAGQSGVAITFVTENQMGKFKRLLKTRTIKRMDIPNAKDVMKIKQTSFIDQLQQLDTKPFYNDLANEILNDLNPEQALASILQLRCNDIFSKRNY
ncbi:MAG: DEAD/DEAH box helicase [Candidatus Margulisiibacteriota bacterium]|nr:DEAD/DEAH box helicase [Candidatus Margulisiibacteriota bacterium]